MKFGITIPALYNRYRRAKNSLFRPPLNRSTEEIFTEIFSTNSWLGKTSVSGSGSDPDQTLRITAELPNLLRQFDISTVLDIPCGDFNWMKNVDLSGIKYLGADIVKELISLNSAGYKSENISFMFANMITDSLPRADLILCRDGLVHLSFADIRHALNNICDSGSKYLLATTFPARQINTDIPTGGWRVLNLQIAPFSFPPPLTTILEGCTENDDAFRDKALGMWRISDVSHSVANMSADRTPN